MPRISVYQSSANAPELRSSMRSAPQYAGVGAKYIAQGLGDVANAAFKIRDEQESSKVTVAASDTMAQLTKSWEDTKTNADINDTDTADKFMQEQVDPALDKLDEGLTGRQARLQAQNLKARIKGDLLVRSNADMASIAGEAAKVNYLTTVDNLAAATVTDSTSLGSAIAMHEQALSGLKGKLNAGQIAELRLQGNSQIAQSAAEGMIDQNPEQFLKDAEGGKFDQFMKGTQKAAAIRAAEQRIKANAAEAKSDAILHRQLAEQHSKDVANGFVSTLMDDNGNFIGSQGELGKFMGRKDVTEEHKSAALSMFTRLTENAAKDDTKTDPSVVNRLTQDIYAGKANEDDVALAIANGLVKADKVNELMGFATEHKTPEGEAIHDAWGKIQSGLKAHFTPQDGLPDPAGEDLILQNETAMRMRYQDGLRAGKSKLDMLTPGTKDYVGKDVVYPTQKEIMQRRAQMSKTGTYSIPAPAGQAASETKGGDRMPGESAADYLKRKG